MCHYLNGAVTYYTFVYIGVSLPQLGGESKFVCIDVQLLELNDNPSTYLCVQVCHYLNWVVTYFIFVCVGVTLPELGGGLLYICVCLGVSLLELGGGLLYICVGVSLLELGGDL